MNEMNLSNRLQEVVSFIPFGSIIADIGSDHAYLPCYAYLQGIISSAIAGEVNEGPYQSALLQVKKSNLTEKIHVKKGNGLAVITDEVDCVTIAGMGGQLIRDILEDGKKKLRSVNRLILQPNVNAINIRKWLLDNHWELIAEKILEEDNKIYEILVAEKGEPSRPYREDIEAALLLGPFLKKEKNKAFFKKWKYELNKWEKIFVQLDKAKQNEDVFARKKEIEKKIILVKEELEI